MLDILDGDMRISDLYYVGKDHHLRNVSAGESFGYVDDLDKLLKNDIYTTNEIEDMEFKSRSMFELCMEKEFETVLIVRIGIQDTTYGYLICAEQRNRRIWQDDEYAIMFFVARMLAVYMQASEEEI